MANFAVLTQPQRVDFNTNAWFTMSYAHFCLHNASFHLDLQITHIAIRILQITLLVRFFERQTSLFFRSNGQNLHFLRNTPARHAINKPFECPIWHSWVFVFLVRRTWLYSFKNIEKHHHHSPLYTTCANRAQSGKSGILKNRTIIGLIPTSHVSSCSRGPTDKKNLPYL